MFESLRLGEQFGPSEVALLSLVAGIVTVLLWMTRRGIPVDAPYLVKGGYPFIGSVEFWTARGKFVRNAIAQSKSGFFGFFVGPYHVVGLSGDEGREMFFESKGLSLGQGYAILFGTGTANNPIGEEGLGLQGEEYSDWFNKRIIRMLRKDYIGTALPKLRSDLAARMQELAENPSGITDPWESVYRIVYQLTLRTVGCDDVAENDELREKTLRLYEAIERSTTPATIVFPWIPFPAKIKRTIAGGRLFLIFKKIIDHRRKTGQRRDDPVQFLMDQGDSIAKIIEFVIGALFAGLINSGINAASVLVYLACDGPLLANARAEIQQVLEKHNPSGAASITDTFASLSIEDWESEFPFLDWCLRESIRIQMSGTAMRKNVAGKALSIGTEVIPNGSVAIFPVHDTHMNPDIYSNPTKFDPDRYSPERAEDKKKKFAYIGWGAGKHPCLGMKFARLEMNMILAYFISTFDYTVVDKVGNPVATADGIAPSIDAYSASKPKERLYLKYKLRP